LAFGSSFYTTLERTGIDILPRRIRSKPFLSIRSAVIYRQPLCVEKYHVKTVHKLIKTSARIRRVMSQRNRNDRRQEADLPLEETQQRMMAYQQPKDYSQVRNNRPGYGPKRLPRISQMIPPTPLRLAGAQSDGRLAQHNIPKYPSSTILYSTGSSLELPPYKRRRAINYDPKDPPRRWGDELPSPAVWHPRGHPGPCEVGAGPKGGGFGGAVNAGPAGSRDPPGYHGYQGPRGPGNPFDSAPLDPRDFYSAPPRGW